MTHAVYHRPMFLTVPVLALHLAASSSGAAAALSPADRIRADVARLAADDWEGRRAGTAGADHAADWIAAEFAAIGLAPAGDAGTYFQSFSFIDGVTLGRGNALGSGEQRWIPEQDFQPLAFSASGAVDAEVVFAGYGIVAKDLGYDDYEGVDVKDRVVVVLRHGPDGDDPQSKWAAFTPLRFKATAARDKGAKALLVVSGPRTKDATDTLVPLRADASLADAGLPAFSVRRAVVEALLARAGTTLDAAQAKLDASHRPAPLALAGVRVVATADVTPTRATTRNVVGLLRGSGPDVVVVGAHYDHLGTGMAGSLDPSPFGKIHHGADDNASGTAALLQLARDFAARRDTLARGVLFVAFGAEEEGTLGSSHFVKHPPLPFERIVAMANMDMVGRLRDALDVHGVGTSPAWKPLVDQAGKAAHLKLNLHDGGYGPSDHNPFYTAGKPVFFVFTGPHPDYHRPSDTPDKIDAGGIVQVLAFVEPVVAGLAASTEPVAFTRVAADKEQQASPSRGFRVWVGGIPDYSEEGIGVRFSGVSPGSPAEKAGLQGGDVLVRFGGKEIRNIYDYTYALGEHKPGDVVAVVVRRGGQDVTIDITLGARPSETR